MRNDKSNATGGGISPALSKLLRVDVMLIGSIPDIGVVFPDEGCLGSSPSILGRNPCPSL